MKFCGLDVADVELAEKVLNYLNTDRLEPFAWRAIEVSDRIRAVVKKEGTFDELLDPLKYIIDAKGRRIAFFEEIKRSNQKFVVIPGVIAGDRMPAKQFLRAIEDSLCPKMDAHLAGLLKETEQAQLTMNQAVEAARTARDKLKADKLVEAEAAHEERKKAKNKEGKKEDKKKKNDK